MVYRAKKACKMRTHVHCIHYYLVLISIFLVERLGGRSQVDGRVG